MGLGAVLAIPGVAPAIGAGLSGFLSWLGGREQAKATTRAADIQARAARQTGAWQQQVARDQLAFQKEEAEKLRQQWNYTQQANWEMERAREARLYGQTGDEMFNRFGLNRQERRMGYEETAADRYNTREELLARTYNTRAELEAALRGEYGRYGATQRRLGTLGRLLGTPQPPGGREIAPLELPAALREPGALRQPDWVPLPEPRQTPFEYPDYVPPPEWT